MYTSQLAFPSLTALRRVKAVKKSEMKHMIVMVKSRIVRKAWVIRWRARIRYSKGEKWRCLAMHFQHMCTCANGMYEFKYMLYEEAHCSESHV